MNKKSYLARVRLPRTPVDWLEAMMNFIFFLCGMLAVGCVVLISVYMVVSGVPAIHKIGLFRFLLGTEWASTAADPKFGILPFILSSVYGTLGATLVGVPIGLLTAVFLSKAAVMFKQILPNVLSPVIVATTVNVAGFILSEASLSFLGVGVPSSVPTWGNILNAAKSIEVVTNYWWLWAVPGVVISVFVLAINFFGDGLRDVLDPKQQ